MKRNLQVAQYYIKLNLQNLCQTFEMKYNVEYPHRPSNSTPTSTI